MNRLSLPHRMRKKMRFLFGTKCLNGIKELNIEADGRGVICQMDAPGSDALTVAKISDFDFDVGKFFDSKEIREKRLNCQGCKISCQQHIYFEPRADHLPKIVFRLVTLPVRVVLHHILVKMGFLKGPANARRF